MKCEIILQKETGLVLKPTTEKEQLHQMISAACNVGGYVTPF